MPGPPLAPIRHPLCHSAKICHGLKDARPEDVDVAAPVPTDRSRRREDSFALAVADQRCLCTERRAAVLAARQIQEKRLLPHQRDDAGGVRSRHAGPWQPRVVPPPSLVDRIPTDFAKQLLVTFALSALPRVSRRLRQDFIGVCTAWRRRSGTTYMQRIIGARTTLTMTASILVSAIGSPCGRGENTRPPLRNSWCAWQESNLRPSD